MMFFKPIPKWYRHGFADRVMGKPCDCPEKSGYGKHVNDSYMAGWWAGDETGVRFNA